MTAAVHSLDAFAFSVPDLDEARRFYEAFGLAVRRDADRLALHTDGIERAWGTVHRLPGRKRLQYLSFACREADEATLAARALSAAGGPAEPHPLGDAGGTWVRHPDGYVVQLVVAPKSSPDARSEPLPSVTVEPGHGAAPNRSSLRQVRPRRLSHVLLFSPDVSRAVDFYEAAFGLRVTDRSGDGIAFMHGVHGSDHHLIALAKSDGPGLHHLSWDVGSIDEVGIGMQQMMDAGHAHGWGVGRHVLGSNYFYYVRDPWGSYCEYSFGIDYVPAGFAWPSGDHPPEDAFYAWGPRVPAEFAVNHETVD